MNDFSPIPTPLSQRWREFKIQVLPVFVFLLVAAAAFLHWQESFTASTLTGEVATVSIDLASPELGILTNLLVVELQMVRKGDAIAELDTAGITALDASLGLLQARNELARWVADLPEPDQQRNTINYEQLRYDLMRERVSLAATRVNLQQAENELRRAKNLYDQAILSEEQFDLAEKSMLALQAEVAEREATVRELTASIQRIEPFIEYTANAADTDLSRTKQFLAQAERQMSTTIIRASMDGMITDILRRPGELVNIGDPIVTITSTRSTEIVGFLRPPLRVEPRPGMRVEVRTRGSKRQIGVAEILRVGMVLQSVQLPLQLRGLDLGQERSILGLSQERGLPLILNVPPELKVRPGELVDLILKPSS